ncbi:MAG: amidohydrolase [Lewinellaceae bacterium]|nr:amidohydrolase [Lewinellaceae bacterium]
MQSDHTDTSLHQHIQTLVEAEYPHYFELFCDYNQHPELGLECHRTAKKQAAELRRAGFEVAEGVGRTGVAAVLKNGPGPTILYRADMDALPIPDRRPAPWRCTDGQLGHQCGHSMHSAMLPFVGYCLHALRDHWSGTALLVAQDGEEGWNGADVMIRDGSLYERFGRPDAALAWHVSPTLPAGTVGIAKGWAFALTQFVDIDVYGVGGHGGNPHMSVDPIVLAAHLITRFQTIVSREIAPIEVAVLSVGAIHGGSKHSIIPEKVALKLTLRSRTEAVYRQMMEAIERICRAEAAASGLPEEKFPKIIERPFITKPLFNDVALANRVEAAFSGVLGAEQVRAEPPYTFGEDFSGYGLDGQIPILLSWLGSVQPDMFDAAGQPVGFLPPLHHEEFNPYPDLTIRTGVTAMTAAMLNLLNGQAWQESQVQLD